MARRPSAKAEAASGTEAEGHGTNGWAVVESLLIDPEVSEILVNGPAHLYEERGGRLQRVAGGFADEAELLDAINRLLRPVGRLVSVDFPLMDERLADGSRISVALTPVAVNGPFVTIRKLAGPSLALGDLLQFGCLSEEMADFLKTAVEARLNILVSGGTGSGKTTVLNVLASLVDPRERLVTVGQTCELRVDREHICHLECCPPNRGGKGEVTFRELLHSAVRMRPDRVVTGELRGGEALDVLETMNSGHDGMLTLLHANSPQEALVRLEAMCLMAGTPLPAQVLRQLHLSALDLVVQMHRLLDGTRKITQIAEVTGVDGEAVGTQPLYLYEQTGREPEGKIRGEFRRTGLRGACHEKLGRAGTDSAQDAARREINKLRANLVAAGKPDGAPTK
jgi:pilus assembly protein CpaF